MATWSEINGLSGGFKKHCKDEVDAKAIVNGTVIVNGSIGGIWESAEESAILNISGGQNTISTYRTMISSDDPYYIQKHLLLLVISTALLILILAKQYMFL